MDHVRRRLRNPRAILSMALLSALVALDTACGSSATQSVSQETSPQASDTPLPASESTPVPAVSTDTSYVLFNQRFI